MPSNPDQPTAEQRFRLAFERLKVNQPKILERNTQVSQNNVAKEAGCDPSALRKARFPTLIREIQAYVEIHSDDRPSKRQTLIKQQNARKGLKERLEVIVTQRDFAQSQLVSAHRRIVELTVELKMVKAQLIELRPLPTPLNKSAIASTGTPPNQ